MRVLITGGCGFIGGALARRLADEHTVTVIDNLSKGQPLNDDRIREFHQSILNEQELHCRVGPGHDVIVHAACVSMPDAVDDPLREMAVNVRGTMEVLSLARATLQRVVYLSSCSVYGQQQHLPIQETADVRPFTPYAAGKLAGESYVRAFCEQGWVDGICLRLSNVYGPWQDPSRHPGVIAKFISSKIAGKEVEVTGDGDDRRDFTYIDDVLDAICRAVESNATGVFNVGTGISTSINEIAAMLDCEKRHVPPRSIDLIRDRSLDFWKISNRLGWKPRVLLEDGLRLTEEWLRSMAVMS